MQNRTYSRTCRTIVVLCAAAGIVMFNIGFQGSAYAGKPLKPPAVTVADPVLVYQRDGDLIVADLNTDGTVKNTAVIHRLNGSGTADWSPDRTEVIFVDRSQLTTTACPVAGKPGLFILNVDDALKGTASPLCLVQLSQDLIGVNSPTWSWSGIVYSDRVGENWDLFFIDPEVVDAKPIPLTESPEWDETDPSWSYKGDRLAFSRSPSGSFNYSDVVVGTVTVSGQPTLTGITSILPGTGLATAGAPDWANDSDLIAVEAHGPVKMDVWVIELGLNNSENRAWNLTEDLLFGRGMPSWSGDDSEIVIFTDVENTCDFKPKDRGGWQLAVIDAVAPSECAEAFIGPPGTNTRQNYPRNLDWLPPQ